MQEKLTAFYRASIAFVLMGCSGSIALLLRVLSFGLLTDFNRRYLVAGSSRLILWLIGVRLQMPSRSQWPKHQVLYTFNHNSFLDVLILTAFGLTRTRFILSESTLKFLPLTISALAIGTWYIPVKQQRARRLQFFERTEARIQKEGCSVFASSEGRHTFIHGIGRFNKGIYHMAQVCKMPVQPVYVHIPKKTNSLESYRYKRGAVQVQLLEQVPTLSWTLEQLAERVSEVRQVFVRKFNEAHKTV